MSHEPFRCPEVNEAGSRRCVWHFRRQDAGAAPSSARALCSPPHPVQPMTQTPPASAFSAANISGSHHQPWARARRKPPAAMPGAPHQEWALQRLIPDTSRVAGLDPEFPLPHRSSPHRTRPCSPAPQSPTVTYYLPAAPATPPLPPCTPGPRTRRRAPSTHVYNREPPRGSHGDPPAHQATEWLELRVRLPFPCCGPRRRAASTLRFAVPACAPGVVPSFTSLRASTRRGRRVPSPCASTRRGCCVLCPTPGG